MTTAHNRAVDGTHREGVLILSVGADRRSYMNDVLASLARTCPGTAVHVITDVPVDVPFTLVPVRAGHASRYYKTQLAQLTPFDVTLFVDDDVIFHRHFGTVESLLPDGSDIAMLADPYCLTVGNFAKKWGHLHTADNNPIFEIAKRDPDRVYHNSGVIAFRRTPAVLTLFESWHIEWMRNQGTDQQPLARVIDKVGPVIGELPAHAHFMPHHHGKEPGREWDGSILHFASKKAEFAPKYHKFHGLPRGMPHKAYLAFANAVKNGLCGRENYLAIVGLILNKSTQRPARMLIFSAGHDTALWAAVNSRGRTVVVEDNPEYLALAADAGVELISVRYETRRGVPVEIPPRPPAAIDSENFDLVFIDGPQGSGSNSPGRELPIAWASKLPGHPTIVLHDFERPWEKWCVKRHGLGEPDRVVVSPGHGDLAIWFQNHLRDNT